MQGIDFASMLSLLSQLPIFVLCVSVPFVLAFPVKDENTVKLDYGTFRGTSSLTPPRFAAHHQARNSLYDRTVQQRVGDLFHTKQSVDDGCLIAEAER